MTRKLIKTQVEQLNKAFYQIDDSIDKMLGEPDDIKLHNKKCICFDSNGYLIKESETGCKYSITFNNGDDISKELIDKKIVILYMEVLENMVRELADKYSR